MPVTRTEQRTRQKKQDAAVRRKRQEDIQELKIVRDRKLGRIHADRDAAQQELDRTHTAAVRQVWDEFRDGMRKLRKRDRDKDTA